MAQHKVYLKTGDIVEVDADLAQLRYQDGECTLTFYECEQADAEEKLCVGVFFNPLGYYTSSKNKK